MQKYVITFIYEIQNETKVGEVYRLDKEKLNSPNLNLEIMKLETQPEKNGIEEIINTLETGEILDNRIISN